MEARGAARAGFAAFLPADDLPARRGAFRFCKGVPFSAGRAAAQPFWFRVPAFFALKNGFLLGHKISLFQIKKNIKLAFIHDAARALEAGGPVWYNTPIESGRILMFEFTYLIKDYLFSASAATGISSGVIGIIAGLLLLLLGYKLKKIALTVVGVVLGAAGGAYLAESFFAPGSAAYILSYRSSAALPGRSLPLSSTG